ncbi:MAG TPA: dihydrodipicolinate synthase family protein [Dehalococcoidia bacterium]|nr:dihydrodipicolinate synthase family protein [Dehalococcoidia bacterium]
MNYSEIKSEIIGPAVLIMTPFDSSYKLNTDALKKNVRHIVNGGISRGKGFIICPAGTGEYNTLSREEHIEVVKAAKDAAKDDIEIIAGIASSSHFEVIERCNEALKLGVRVAMIPPPYYYHGMDQEATIHWYSEIARQTEIGIMIYDQSWRSLGGTVDGPATEKLLDIKSVVSIKRGFLPSFQDYVETLDRFSDKLAMVDNSYGHTAGLSHQHGATSYITGIAAFWPQGEAKFWNLLQSGKYREADKLHSRQATFWRFVDEDFGGYATNVLKAAAEYVGIEAGSVRPPFRDLNNQEKGILANILADLGVEKA